MKKYLIVIVILLGFAFYTKAHADFSHIPAGRYSEYGNLKYLSMPILHMTPIIPADTVQNLVINSNGNIDISDIGYITDHDNDGSGSGQGQVVYPISGSGLVEIEQIVKMPDVTGGQGGRVTVFQVNAQGGTRQIKPDSHWGLYDWVITSLTNSSTLNAEFLGSPSTAATNYHHQDFKLEYDFTSEIPTVYKGWRNTVLLKDTPTEMNWTDWSADGAYPQLSAGYYLSFNMFSNMNDRHFQIEGITNTVYAPIDEPDATDTQIEITDIITSPDDNSFEFSFDYYLNTTTHNGYDNIYYSLCPTGLSLESECSHQGYLSNDILENQNGSMRFTGTTETNGTHLLMVSIDNGLTGDNYDVAVSDAETLNIGSDIIDVPDWLENTDYGCSLTNLKGCIKTFGQFLFVPSSDTTAIYIGFYNDLGEKFPFAYVYDLQTQIELMENNASSTDFAITMDFNGYGDLDLISRQQLLDIPLSAQIRTIIGYLLWFMFGVYAYNLVLSIFNNNTNKQ